MPLNSIPQLKSIHLHPSSSNLICVIRLWTTSVMPTLLWKKLFSGVLNSVCVYMCVSVCVCACACTHVPWTLWPSGNHYSQNIFKSIKYTGFPSFPWCQVVPSSYTSGILFCGLGIKNLSKLISKWNNGLWTQCFSRAVWISPLFCPCYIVSC